MKSYVYYFLLFLLCWCTIDVLAQNLKFDTYSSAQGLSHSNVVGLHVDQLGFALIGTDDGLNIYDGITFKVLRHQYDNENSLLDNRVLSIAEDSTGILWLGSDVGLTRYDRSLEQFRRYQHDPEDPHSLRGANVHTLLFDSKDRFWVGTDDGLSLYRPASDDFLNLRHEPGNENSLAQGHVLEIVEHASGQLWIGTATGGLSRYDPANQSFINYTTAESSPIRLGEDHVRTILFDSRDRVWLGHFSKGTTRIDLNTNTADYFEANADDPNSLSNNYVQRIIETDTKDIWLATDGGLNVYQESSEDFRVYRSNVNDKLSLSSNSLTNMIQDDAGNIWIATRLGGVCLYDADKYAFDLFTTGTSGLSNNKAAGFSESEDGIVAVATDGGGVNFLDLKTQAFTNLRHEPGNDRSITNDKVLAVQYDNEGWLWFGMWNGGVHRYNPKTGQLIKFAHDPSDPSSLGSDNIFQLLKDREGNIWIGYWNAGIGKYNWDTQAFTNYGPSFFDLHTVTSNHLREDAKGQIWISDEREGVIVFNPISETYRSYLGGGEEGDLASNKISMTLEDSKGRIWIGTLGGGLNRLDPESNQFIAYRKRDGLPSDGIVGILEDSRGLLWLSTTNGLSQFDPEQKSFKNYGVGSGLQSAQFNERARLKLSTGEMLFGGNDGFNMFHPENVNDNLTPPRVYLTDLKVGNEPVSVSADGILQRSMLYADGIELKDDQNFLSFDFIGINHRGGSQNRYEYMMEGLQDKWINNENETKVSFTNLSPGEYRLRIRATNSDNVPSEKEAAIDIYIAPPFWMTWWFLSVVVLMVFLGARYVYRLRVKALKVNQRLLEEKVNEATSQVEEQNAVLASQAASLKKAIAETNLVVQRVLDSGDFSARIDLSGQEDEWAELGGSINHLFESVVTPFNQINHIINQMAQGDLTHRFTAEVKGDVRRVAENLNMAMDTLSDLLTEISESVRTIGESSSEMLAASERISAGTTEIASTVQEMSRGADKQLQKVDESSRIVEAILRASDDMGHQAEAINETASKGVRKSEEGSSEINKLDVNMTDILEFSENTSRSITTLSERSHAISGIVKLIKDIAAQTNLLALNAAIEAANAGEAGRGFAVVADEIRNLAEGSKKSVNDIEELILDVQKDTQASVALIQSMSSSVKEGEQAAKTSLKAFNEMAAYYREAFEKSEQIVDATRQQTSDVGGVVTLMSNVVVIAEETATGTEQGAVATNELSAGMSNFTERTNHVSQIAKDLQEKVGHFKLNDRGQLQDM
ncbi:MAG: two-component regulator propeller domain-containing protein [Bacteroidota bacterium]